MYLKKPIKIVFDAAVENYTWYRLHQQKQFKALTDEKAECEEKLSRECFLVYCAMCDVLEAIDKKVDWSGKVYRAYKKAIKDDNY